MCCVSGIARKDQSRCLTHVWISFVGQR
jgi:hypothetical protein